MLLDNKNVELQENNKDENNQTYKICRAILTKLLQNKGGHFIFVGLYIFIRTWRLILLKCFQCLGDKTC